MNFKLLLTAFLTILLFSCDKESTNSPKPIEGLWVGTYTINTLPAQGSLFYSFSIYPDGTVLTKGKGADGKNYYSTGPWTLTGNTFSATIVSFVTPNNGAPVTQTITATYSDNGTLTNGVKTDINNPNGAQLAGKFSMQKVD